MKTTYKKMSVLLLAVFCFQSCIEDAVEVEIPSSITGGNFPKVAGDLRAILTGLYDGVRDEYNRSLYGEDRGDALEVGLIGSVSDSWAQNLNGGNGPNWRANYTLINNVNIVLSTAEEISFNSPAQKGQILGEAYFIRAFVYFQLVKIWGDVPLLLSPVDQNTAPVGRTAATEVMAQIFSDIQASLTNLPGNGFTSKYAASKPAAYSLLADAKLWSAKVLGGGEQDFMEAITAVDNIEGVGLLDNFGAIFDTKANAEVIFSIFMDFNEQAGMYASTVTSRDVNVDPVLNPDVPTSTSFNARHNYRPSDIIMDLFDNPDDNRASRTFIPILTQDGDDPDSDPDVLSISQNKFRGTNDNNDTHYDNDIIVYRLADMLLLRAEAKAALDQVPAAVADLDLVRERADLGPYEGAMDKNTVELEILEERGRELFLELKRYWDLVRFDAGGTIDIRTQVPNLTGTDIPLLWPINDNVIAENELIVQTPGYD